MISIKKWWRKFLRDKEGSTIAEYALAAAILSIIFFVAIASFGDMIVAAVDHFFF